MTGAPAVAILLAAAAALAAVRIARRGAPHRGARIALSCAAAALLYVLLFPPATRETFAAGELVVLTPGVTDAQLGALGAAAAVVALPGAAERGRYERAPDLGTALRRHADLRRLRIVGGGLPARDRDAARGLVAQFDAAPAPRGVTELDAPAWVRAGRAWTLAGRVEAVAGGRVELADPSGAVVAGAALGDDGRFTLSAQAKGPGTAAFALRVLDPDGARIEETRVPLAVREGEPLRLQVLAGAPDPDLKYLRRWAVDAGARLASRIGLSEGVALSEGAVALDAGSLRDSDVVVVDERAWAALDASARAALHAAVRDGLGLLLRVTGPVPAPVAEDWAALGFRLRAADVPTGVALPPASGEAAAALTRRPIEVAAADAAALLRAADGAPLALWRAEGRGRIGLWWLADSWRLALGGDGARHASLWSEALGALARPRGTQAPQLPQAAWVDQRAVLCGLSDGAAVEPPQGGRVALRVETDPAGRACAAYWPQDAGWHALVVAGARWPFYVRADGEAPSLAAAADRRATRALVGAAAGALATRPRPLPRWPLFLGFVLVAGALWLLERRRPA